MPLSTSSENDFNKSSPQALNEITVPFSSNVGDAENFQYLTIFGKTLNVKGDISGMEDVLINGSSAASVA